MEKTIQIRAAGLQDAGLITEIARKTFMETYGDMNTPENMEAYLQSQFSNERMKEEMESRHARFFLAYLDNVPAAFTKVRDDRQAKKLENIRALEIQRIYVLREYQGFSLGKAMLDMVKGLAQAEGYQTIWLQVWQKNNKAIRFYQKAGFMVFETASFLLGDSTQQDFLMRYDLFY
jgi:ribosomal protein S18 acetylase RimI-like enzyme